MATKPSKRPPPTTPEPRTPEEYLIACYRRIVRMETRQGRIMEHLGLDSRGDPLPPNPTTKG